MLYLQKQPLVGTLKKQLLLILTNIFVVLLSLPEIICYLWSTYIVFSEYFFGGEAGILSFPGTKYIYRVLIFIWFLLELNVFEHSWLQINKHIVCGKEAFLTSDFLEHIKCLRQENGTGESIITIPRTLKRKMIDTFPEEISLYRNGKYFIVQSNNVNPCQFIVAVLNDKGLKVTFTRKLFFAIN